jgi:hypothetical protein
VIFAWLIDDAYFMSDAFMGEMQATAFHGRRNRGCEECDSEQKPYWLVAWAEFLF